MFRFDKLPTLSIKTALTAAASFLFIILCYRASSFYYDRDSQGLIRATSTSGANPLLRTFGGSQCLPQFDSTLLTREAKSLRESCQLVSSYPPPIVRVGTITAHYGDTKPPYQKALRTHMVHSLVHETQLLVMCSPIVDGIWNKVVIILSILLEEMMKPAQERLEWLFWTDRDTIVLDPCRPISSFLPPQVYPHSPKASRSNKSGEKREAHLIISGDWNGLNAGVFLVRVNPWAIDFFTDLLAFRYYQPNVSLPFEEQSVVEILAKDPKFRENVEQVPSVWFNAYPGDSPTDYMNRENEEGLEYYNARRGDFLLHFAGVPGKDELIDQWSDMLALQKSPWRAEQILRNLTVTIEHTWAARGYDD